MMRSTNFLLPQDFFFLWVKLTTEPPRSFSPTREVIASLGRNQRHREGKGTKEAERSLLVASWPPSQEPEATTPRRGAEGLHQLQAITWVLSQRCPCHARQAPCKQHGASYRPSLTSCCFSSLG